jgi:GAF domain-containing protein
VIGPELRHSYALALRRHVRAADEATLREGYELGRRAVEDRCSALELAAIHHDALVAALRETADPPELVVSSAAAFFQESLSAFEMLHRGFREAAAAAAAERRSATMIRRLSSFLTDASLSARQPGADAEVLHLVAEHARELTSATCASASWCGGEDDLRACSFDSDASLDCSRLLERLEVVGSALATRVMRADWPEEPELRDLPVSNVLTVPLTTLDGRHAGRLQLAARRDGDFTDVDEAVAVHLADMTSAALERVQLYTEGRFPSHPGGRDVSPFA